jgi:hypothetical protein
VRRLGLEPRPAGLEDRRAFHCANDARLDRWSAGSPQTARHCWLGAVGRAGLEPAAAELIAPMFGRPSSPSDGAAGRQA